MELNWTTLTLLVKVFDGFLFPETWIISDSNLIFKVLIIEKHCVKIVGVILVRISSHSDWIRRDTRYVSVFNPNEGKYGPEKIPNTDTFYAVKLDGTKILEDSLNILP